MKQEIQAIFRDGRIDRVTDAEEALAILRHSTSHLMALAVIDLYPDVRLGIGPPTDEGFYYDFQTPHRFTDVDLPGIESRMKELAAANLSFEPAILSTEEALEYFQTRGEVLKAELIRDRADQVLSSYKVGELTDFCKGPHVVRTDQLGVFKLLSVAGSYWRGDEKREQLQRIYGTAFFTSEDLDRYLATMEEARQRDHRKLGTRLGLYTIEEKVAPGLIFWHPKGAVVRGIVEQFLRGELEARGYQFVYTPHIARSNLWKTSGHYEYFREHMFTLPVGEDEYVLKPMNCPGHIMIYQSARRSYRELPMKIAEFGTVYRYEKSGTLHGMLRVRGFTQDDAHIFCSTDQVLEEVVQTLDLAQFILNAFGFEDFSVALSVSDPESPKQYAGSPDDWAKAEQVLVEALEQKGWEYERKVGEAAFYGPKIDINLIDALGRSWQLSTFQFDFSLPQRFEVTYVGSDSREHHVIMIHRALLGSLERFMGVLIEHYAGAFPTWLAPVQVVVLPISEHHHDYAGRVVEQLAAAGLRIRADLRSEKIGFKIREAQVQKLPYMLIVGNREVEQGNVAVRHRRDGDLGPMDTADFADRVREETETRSTGC